VIRAHQPGSEPIDIPEVIPNPVVVPEQTPTPSEPAPRKPAETPEKVPVDYLPPHAGRHLTPRKTATILPPERRRVASN
jgi:hypothetical protein